MTRDFEKVLAAMLAIYNTLIPHEAVLNMMETIGVSEGLTSEGNATGELLRYINIDNSLSFSLNKNLNSEIEYKFYFLIHKTYTLEQRLAIIAEEEVYNAVYFVYLPQTEEQKLKHPDPNPYALRLIN